MSENLPDKPPSSLEESNLVSILLPEAIVVLQNDFHAAGIDAEFSNENFPDVFQLRNKLASLITQKSPPGSEAFFRLLYRADIPEKNLKNSSGEARYETKIAELLVIRALQRVYFRMKFGK